MLERSKTTLTGALLLASTVLAGCNMAPRYEAPVAPVAPDYPAMPRNDVAPNATDLGWRDFFNDPRLQSLIATSLERNRDLAQSYARIDQARAQYRVQASQRLPAIEVTGNGARTQQPLAGLGAIGSLGDGSGGGGEAPDSIRFSQFTANAGVSAFELDLWGRVANLSEAQRQAWLASVEGARAFRISLIAQVASTYFDIRAGEEQIEFAERSLNARREGVRIARMRLDAGVTSTVDFDQAVLLLTQAETELAEIRRTTEQARNLLQVLVGGPITEPLPAAIPMSDQLHPISAGLPSELLAARPDVLQAEHNLRGANANIGAARAAFFPTISLTGTLGYASSALGDLFNSGNDAWSYGGSLGLPIFDWGRRSANLKLSKAQAEELIAAYQRTVQGAFQEVADALVARQRFDEQIDSQYRTVEAQRRLARAARLRYDNGISIYLEVLDAERNLFSANQTMIQLRTAGLQNAVSLYAALGGGLVETGPAAEGPPAPIQPLEP